MVPVDSRRVPRAPRYSGTTGKRIAFSPTGLSPSSARLSRRFVKLAAIRFRSPLLTESRLISFPPGTEMFQFPGLAPDGLCIHPPVTPAGCPVTPGFPIRRSPDHSSFDSSPRLIAAYHVLHRLSTPRHPPCALKSLTTLMRGCHPRTEQPSTRDHPDSMVKPTSGASNSTRRPPGMPSPTGGPARPETSSFVVLDPQPAWSVVVTVRHAPEGSAAAAATDLRPPLHLS